MKKKIIYILLILLLTTGCGDKKDKKEDYSNQKLSDVTEPIITTPIEDSNINKIDDSNNNEKLPPETCNSKVFEKTFTYVYETREDCIKNGSRNAAEISETIDPTVDSYGCEAIKDECGTIWYGVYFNTKDPETNKAIRKNY